MNKRQYLLKEAEKWKEAGILDQRQWEQIVALYPEAERKSPLPVFAGTLLGLGALTFVASNWDGMSEWVKLAVILLGLVFCYGFAEWLRQKGYERVGMALTVAGLAVYGSGFFLIGQMYHLSANPVTAFYLWFLGAVALAWHYQSRLLTVLAQLILVTSAIYGEGNQARFGDETLWFYLLALAGIVPLVRRFGTAWLAGVSTLLLLAVAAYDLGDAGGALAVQALLLASLLGGTLLKQGGSLFAWPLRASSWAGITLFAIVMIFGEPVRHEMLDAKDGWWTLVNLVLLLGTAAVTIRQRMTHRLTDLLPYLPVPAIYGWMWLSSQADWEWYPLDVVMLIALFVTALAMVLAGERRGESGRLYPGTALFGIACFVGYVNFAWDFLDKSLFFLGGGALLLALSWWLEWTRRRVNRAGREAV